MARATVKSPVTLARIRALRTARDNAERDWRKHQQICSSCHLAVNLSRQACDTGWELAMKWARTRNNWANREMLASGNYEQDTLF